MASTDIITFPSKPHNLNDLYYTKTEISKRFPLFYFYNGDNRAEHSIGFSLSSVGLLIIQLNQTSAYKPTVYIGFFAYNKIGTNIDLYDIFRTNDTSLSSHLNFKTDNNTIKVSSDWNYSVYVLQLTKDFMTTDNNSSFF